MSARQPGDCFALPPGVDWTPVDVALDRLRQGLVCVTEAEGVALGEAAGRVLASTAVALRDAPPAANSAVDGYAYAHPGASGRLGFALAQGRAAAGRPWPGRLGPGEAVRILTGAALPDGADSVALEEDCEIGPGEVAFAVPTRAGANARPRAEDACAGQPVLAAGRRLAPQDLARAAAAGIGRLELRRRLRVAVLSTGDEIVPAGAADAAGPLAIPDANGPMLAALVARWGAEPVPLGIAPDSESAVRAALDRGAAEADAVLSTGGASAGDEDHVSRLLGAEGRREIWRIAMKPGRPMAMGLWRGVPVFGLPGNPVAAFVCALVFARPALAVMAGEGWPEPLAMAVPAAFAKRKKPGRREYLRARLDGAGRAETFHSEGSGLVGSLSWADGLVELPDGGLDIAPGDPVRFLPFAGFGL